MTALVNLTRLRELRAKMTTGEWRRESEWHVFSDHYAEREIVSTQLADDATGIVATHEAADTLIEIAMAALAWKEAHDASIGDAYMRCPAGPSMRTQQELTEAAGRLLAALAKVAP